MDVRKEWLGGPEMALSQPLQRVYLILGLCECRVCYFLKPKPFGNWGKWSSFCLFVF